LNGCFGSIWNTITLTEPTERWNTIAWSPRPIEAAEQGKIIELPWVDGLHHRYMRQAA
jgi:hypothetical protein